MSKGMRGRHPLAAGDWTAALVLWAGLWGCTDSGPAAGATPAAVAEVQAAEDGGETAGGGPAAAEVIDTAPPADAGELPDAAIGPPPCPAFLPGAALGKLKAAVLSEISGVADSRRNPGVFWVHNDSGDLPRIYAINIAGKPLAQFNLGGADHVDWEDIAVGLGADPTATYLFVGDIGDNEESRASVRIYRAAEPAVDPGKLGVIGLLGDVVAQDFTYPDGAHDAESLMVDPLSDGLFIVTKAKDGKSKVYMGSFGMGGAPAKVLSKVGKLHFGGTLLPGDVQATAADISADGLSIAVRTGNSAFLWRRLPSESVALAMLAAPCPLAVRKEDQGEALGWAADGSGYYTVGEGADPTIFFYRQQ